MSEERREEEAMPFLKDSGRWFVWDPCGIVCAVFTYLLIVYGEFVVLAILAPPFLPVDRNQCDDLHVVCHAGRGVTPQSHVHRPCEPLPSLILVPVYELISIPDHARICGLGTSLFQICSASSAAGNSVRHVRKNK